MADTSNERPNNNTSTNARGNGSRPRTKRANVVGNSSQQQQQNSQNPTNFSPQTGKGRGQEMKRASSYTDYGNKQQWSRNRKPRSYSEKQSVPTYKPWFKGTITLMDGKTGSVTRADDQKFHFTVEESSAQFTTGTAVKFHLRDVAGNSSQQEAYGLVVDDEKYRKPFAPAASSSQEDYEEEEESDEEDGEIEVLHPVPSSNPETQPAANSTNAASTTTSSVNVLPPKPIQREELLFKEVQQALVQILALQESLKNKEQRLEDVISYHEDIVKKLKQDRQDISESLKQIEQLRESLEDKQRRLEQSLKNIQKPPLVPQAAPQAVPPSVPKTIDITPIKKEIDPKHLARYIEPLINEKKIADAAELLPSDATKVPLELAFKLFETLRNPRDVPTQAAQRIIEVVVQGVKSKFHIPNVIYHFFSLMRGILVHYDRIMASRSYDPIKQITAVLFKEAEQMIPRSIPKPSKLKYRDLMHTQSYLSVLMVGVPTSSRLFTIMYKAVLQRIEEDEQKRGEKIRKWTVDFAKLYNRPQDSLGSPQRGVLQGNEQILLSPPAISPFGSPMVSPAASPSASPITPPLALGAAYEDESSDEDEEETVFNEDDEDEDQETKKPELDFARLSTEANILFEQNRPTPEEIVKKKDLLKDIEQACIIAFPEEKFSVHMYGSSASNFGTKGSDVDICVKFDSIKNVNDTKQQGNLLRQIQKVITPESSFKHLSSNQQIVMRSRVPVLKIVDGLRNVECDICVDNFLGVVNTRMLRTYSELDPRVTPLVHILKSWASQRHINDPPSGTLSSYAYVLLALHYLQACEVVPSLQELAQLPNVDPADVPQPHYVNAYDCRYYANLQNLKNVWPKLYTNTMTLGELVVGFFNYYVNKFDFNKQTASIKAGRPIVKKWNNPLSIEDPFETRDLGGVVSNEQVNVIVSEFKRAQTILSYGGGLADLLKEREDYDEENIYTKKTDYEEHGQLEEVLKLIEEKKLFKGVLRTNKKAFSEAYVTVEGLEHDIFIDGMKARNRAIHGDIVAVKILEEKSQAASSENENGEESVATSKTIAGTVVAIVEKRSPRLFACKMMKQDDDSPSKGFRWLLPLDKAYPRIMCKFEEFKLTFNTRADNLEELLFIVELSYPWKSTHHYPKGKVVSTLGLKKDIWSQKRAILVQGMPEIYEPIFQNRKGKQMHKIALEHLPVHTAINFTDKPTSVTEIETIDFEKDGYDDWRKRRVFTIDPITSKDLDDALSIEKLNNGKYLITVYVADVAKFVKEDDPIDLEARKRATSVYMIDIVEHMLDPKLSQNLASMLPGVTRYSLAVQFEMDQNAVIDESTIEFHRAVVISCCQLDYDTAQEVIENKKITRQDIVVHNGFTFEHLREDIKTFNTLAQTIRKRRKVGGSLFLSNEKLNFEVDEEGYPVGFKHDVHNESHQLIEEFMLIANKLAGKALFDFFGEDALLRRHTPPDEMKWFMTVNKLIRCCKSLLQNDVEATAHLNQLNLAKLLEEQQSQQYIMNLLISCVEKYPKVQQAIQHFLLREMQLAKYIRVGDVITDKNGTNHYALNTAFYTHFTSPIRRYADTLVHRFLLYMMQEQKVQNPSLKSTAVKNVAKPRLVGKELSACIQHINDNSYAAKNIGEQCSRQYLSYYLMPKLEENVVRVEAIIMSLGRRSFTAFIPKWCVEVQCNIMKQFSPLPSSIKEVETPLEGEALEQQELLISKLELRSSGEKQTRKDSNVNIEALVLTWTKDPLPLTPVSSAPPSLEAPAPEATATTTAPSSTEAATTTSASSPEVLRTIELKALKTVLVDIDVETQAVPYDILIYNVWEEHEIAPVFKKHSSTPRANFGAFKRGSPLPSRGGFKPKPYGSRGSESPVTPGSASSANGDSRRKSASPAKREQQHKK